MNSLTKQFAILAGSMLMCVNAVPAAALQDALGPEGINAYAVHAKGITGEGVHIALLSNGNVRDSHIAFERTSGSAVKNYDFTGDGLSRSSHETHIAGIILSTGSRSHPDQVGAAPGATICSGRFSNKYLSPKTVTTALDELITKHSCRIILTGIQLPKNIVTPDGDSTWTKLYDYYAERYDVLFIAAAGNSSGTITVFGDCYNGITTAGMVRSEPNSPYDTIGSASNPGPTADGRRKPEVAAPTQGLIVPDAGGDDHWSTVDESGRGLTSFAIPHTAAVAALLLEAAAKSPVQNDDRTEVIKAVIINAADSSVFHDSPSTTAWDPKSGYGKLDALKAYETLTAGPIEPDTPSKQSMGWAYGRMGANESRAYTIQGKKGQRLIVTVTWHRKLEKIRTQFFEEPVRFYLDLKLVSPSDKIPGFETAGPNNLIKTDFLLNEDGPYTIVLNNPTGAENRDYGMAFELAEVDSAPSR